ISISSVRSLLSEASTSARMRARVAWRNGSPLLQSSPTLVAITTRRLRPPDASAFPTISSDLPKPYTGAVSTSEIPRSIAEWIVRIDSCSSVPPHIHPPIAHVPRPMRENSRSSPSTLEVSIFFLLSRVARVVLDRLNRFAVARRLSYVHCDQLARAKGAADLDRVTVIMAKRHLDQFEAVVTYDRQIDFVVAEDECVVGRRQTRGRHSR